MNYERLNLDWNAEPNAPEPKLLVKNGNVMIEFYLNSFLSNKLSEYEIGKLTFINCQKYEFNNMNDEGFYSGKYRYKESDLPWGEFYKLSTLDNDFPKNCNLIENNSHLKNLSHYLFFFRDNIFECLAENYKFEYIK